MENLLKELEQLQEKANTQYKELAINRHHKFLEYYYRDVDSKGKELIDVIGEINSIDNLEKLPHCHFRSEHDGESIYLPVLAVNDNYILTYDSEATYDIFWRNQAMLFSVEDRLEVIKAIKLFLLNKKPQTLKIYSFHAFDLTTSIKRKSFDFEGKHYSLINEFELIAEEVELWNHLDRKYEKSYDIYRHEDIFLAYTPNDYIFFKMDMSLEEIRKDLSHAEDIMEYVLGKNTPITLNDIEALSYEDVFIHGQFISPINAKPQQKNYFI